MKIQLKVVWASALVLSCLRWESARASECPKYPQDRAQLVVDTAEQMPGVEGVGFIQKGCKVRITLRVVAETEIEEAKRLGDNVVRMSKTYGLEKAPSKEIGPGIYLYEIDVKREGTGKWVVRGMKHSLAPRIKWR